LFKEDLQLSGYAKRSIELYVSSVLRLQRFYNQPLEDITSLKSSFVNTGCAVRVSSAGAPRRCGSAIPAFSIFFCKTLVCSWKIFEKIKWKREQALPTILSLAEVRQIIDALPTLQSHTFYLTLYSLGPRPAGDRPDNRTSCRINNHRITT